MTFDFEDVEHVLLLNNLVCRLLALGNKGAILEVIAGKALVALSAQAVENGHRKAWKALLAKAPGSG